MSERAVSGPARPGRPEHRTLRRTRILAALLCLTLAGAAPAPHPYFRISIIDSATGRGVPLVQLKTTNAVCYYTDSGGNVAFDDAGLMGTRVFFSISSDGYEYRKDGFGYTGEALDVREGGEATIRLTRRSIAERLYRVTGEGIYRDSLMLGLPPPTHNSQANGLVMGQDTVEVTRYRDRLYWFWGDTARPAYPLGNFHTSGATSRLPGAGGLDPDLGVDLSYFTDSGGFCKAMLPSSEPGPVWVGGLCTLRDAAGKERLVCNYARMKSLGEPVERGLAQFNDEKAVFEPISRLDLNAPRCPLGHPFHRAIHGTDRIYSAMPDGTPVPAIRVPAHIERAKDAAAYEAFTCLAPGSKWQGAETRLERGPDGDIVYGWKRDTDALDYRRQQELINAGKLRSEEALVQLTDAETGAQIRPANGSVYWNPYRRRWVMIFGEHGGSTSLLGEIWFAEADSATGPWVYARKIVTHNDYTFYNPTQHPFMDKDGGKRIFFEGTYTNQFSGSKTPTPRYDYNQIMYGLELDDPRLSIPEPIYLRDGAGDRAEYTTAEELNAGKDQAPPHRIAFFAPTRPGLLPDLATVYRTKAGRLTTDAPAPGAQPLFYGLSQPREGAVSVRAVGRPAGRGDMAPLYEYRDGAKRWIYSTDPNLAGRDRVRSPLPLCLIWKSPMSITPLDWPLAPQ